MIGWAMECGSKPLCIAEEFHKMVNVGKRWMWVVWGGGQGGGDIQLYAESSSEVGKASPECKV